jgi:hypothetical protein
MLGPAVKIILAASAISVAVTACASRPGLTRDYSTKGMLERQTGAVVMAVKAANGRDIFNRPICGGAEIHVVSMDAKRMPARRSGRLIEESKDSVFLFTFQLPAGEWGIWGWTCITQSKRVYRSEGAPFAVFSVSVGEVVDIGQIDIAMQQHGGVPLLFATGYSAVTFVDPLDDATRARIRPSLRERIVQRPMRPGNVFTRQQLVAICQHERSRAVSARVHLPVCERLKTVPGPTPQIGPPLGAVPTVATKSK